MSDPCRAQKNSKWQLDSQNACLFFTKKISDYLKIILTYGYQKTKLCREICYAVVFWNWLKQIMLVPTSV